VIIFGKGVIEMLKVFILLIIIVGIIKLTKSKSNAKKGPTPFELQQAAAKSQRTQIMNNYYQREKQRAEERYKQEQNELRKEIYLQSLPEHSFKRIIEQYGENVPEKLYKHIQTPDEIIGERKHHTSLLEQAADKSEERKLREELKESQKNLQKGMEKNQKTLKETSEALQKTQITIIDLENELEDIKNRHN
jgi:hypothetical protein